MIVNKQNTTPSQRYDPTLTTGLRNAFSRDMKHRFNELMQMIVVAIVKQDCFALGTPKINTFQMVPPGFKAFDFLTDPAKVEEFMRWLQTQVDKGLLTIGEGSQIGQAIQEAWTNRYILDSYKRGIIRARYELQKAGYPSLESSGGIDVSMNIPIHLDRVGLLYIRAFNELKGVTDAMSQAISRVLTQGMIDGDGMRLIARKLVATINGQGIGDLGLTDILGRYISPMQRALTIARTEIVRAHHLATIQEYRNWGVLGIKVMGEWSTTNDDRVCNECASLDGKIFTLDEIEPMIPRHPNCRCVALPYIAELEPYYSN